MTLWDRYKYSKTSCQQSHQLFGATIDTNIQKLVVNKVTNFLERLSIQTFKN